MILLRNESVNLTMQALIFSQYFILSFPVWAVWQWPPFVALFCYGIYMKLTESVNASIDLLTIF